VRRVDTPEPWWRPRPVELLLGVGLGIVGVAEVVVPFESRTGSGSVVWTAAVTALVGVALLWSRRQPLVPVVVIGISWSVLELAGASFITFYGGFLPLLATLFMAVRFGRGRTPVAGSVLAFGFLVAIDVFEPSMRHPAELLFHWTVTTLVFLAAFGLRRHEWRAEQSMRRAVAAEVGAAEQAMHAVVAERTRIARELHDIVAHAMTSMVVQAGAAEQAAGDRQFVDDALASIRRTGNDALAEMRRLVTMLREDEEAPLAPQPRLEALPALVAATTTHGPSTRLEVLGAERELPAGLDLAVYRIVQEALTNVRKHARARECVVRLEYRPDEVRLEVLDDGDGGDPDGEPGGHGLVGMRERVGMYGGRLDAGSRGDAGGFAVRAVLPVAT
jgi:signal transduction histidine kinase